MNKRQSGMVYWCRMAYSLCKQLSPVRCSRCGDYLWGGGASWPAKLLPVPSPREMFPGSHKFVVDLGVGTVAFASLCLGGEASRMFMKLHPSPALPYHTVSSQTSADHFWGTRKKYVMPCYLIGVGPNSKGPNSQCQVWASWGIQIQFGEGACDPSRMNRNCWEGGW